MPEQERSFFKQWRDLFGEHNEFLETMAEAGKIHDAIDLYMKSDLPESFDVGARITLGFLNDRSGPSYDEVISGLESYGASDGLLGTYISQVKRDLKAARKGLERYAARGEEARGRAS